MLLAGNGPPTGMRSECGHNPAAKSDKVHKIFKLMQRIRLGTNFPGPTGTCFGVRIASLDPPVCFLALTR